ncbi:hypothetical protein MYX82_10490 [Acidobacteria bacterium AH-259-D05]|nr:hypothetical protein [Acidobacteria bacterium AH-259-D05]
MRPGREDLGLEDTLPIQLQIRVLRTELEQIELDAHRLDQLKAQILDEISHYEDLLVRTKRQRLLRRVK